jgi:hypothetical protein
LKGLPLKSQRIYHTPVSDLTPRKGMPLREIGLDFRTDRDTEVLRAALEQQLVDPKVCGEPRATLLFGLAQVLDGQGDYARAAECLREANALALEHVKKRHRDYNPAQHEQFVDNMLQSSDAAFFARTAGSGSDSRWSVFVFGLPRAGIVSPSSHGGGADEGIAWRLRDFLRRFARPKQLDALLTQQGKDVLDLRRGHGCRR